jgi:hypothetical protein
MLYQLSYARINLLILCGFHNPWQLRKNSIGNNGQRFTGHLVRCIRTECSWDGNSNGIICHVREDDNSPSCSSYAAGEDPGHPSMAIRSIRNCQAD